MLKQTKGYSKMRGIITGLDRHYAFSPFALGQKLKFSIATSANNRILVQMVAFDSAKSRDVFMGSTTMGEKGIFVPFEERYTERDGYRLLGTNLKKTSDEKEAVTILTDEDAIEFVMQNFKDGDSVFVETELTKDMYNNSIYLNHKIRKMYPTTKPVDFEADDFEEMAEFRDNFVFSEATFSKADKKGTIEGYSINYKKEPLLVSYAINVKDKDDYAIYEYFEKNIKFGDLVQVEGIVHNRVEGHREEIEEDIAEDTNNEPLVGKKPKSFDRPKFKKKGDFIVDFEQRELEITAITSVEKGAYTKAELVGDGGEDLFTNDDDDKLPWE